MPGERWTWSTALKAVGLLAALGFVVGVQYIPHLATFENEPSEGPGLVQLGEAWKGFIDGSREGFPWPVHVDEHYHMAVVGEVQELNHLLRSQPYAENPETVSALGSLRGAVHERGFHLFTAQIQELTGISYVDFAQVMPALWMGFTALAVYALVRPHPAAIPAAALVGLSPSTLRFLGTGFLVPIGFSLAWLPAVGLMIEPARRKTSTAALMLAVTVWAFFVHLVTGFAAMALILLAAVFSSGQARKNALKLVAVGLIPVLWLWRSFSAGIQDEIAKERILPTDFTVFDHFGVITLFVWGLGVALMVLDPPEENRRAPVAAFAALSLVSMGLIIASVTFDLNQYATYSRMHPIFFLTAAVPAAFGMVTAGRTVAGLASKAHRRALETWRSWPSLPTMARPAITIVVVLAIFTPATSQAVSYHIDEPYYRVMTNAAWTAFNDAENATGGDDSPYDVYLSHPWQAPFYSSRSDKIPHAVLFPGSPPVNNQDWQSYRDRNADPEMFVMNDITIVVGPSPPPGDFWTKEGRFVWVMEERYAEQIHRIRNGQSLQLPDAGS